MKKMALVLIVFLCAQPLYSEHPPKPSMEDIVDSSGLIVMAEPVNTIEIDASINCLYRVITFRIHDIYKGVPNTDPIEMGQINDKMILGPLLM